MAGKRITDWQRVRLVELFESGVGYRRAAGIVGCDISSAQHICDRWRIHGRLVLMHKPVQTQYAFEVKLDAVTRFLQGETALAIAKDLQLSAPSVVHRWVRVYRTEGEQGLRRRRGRARGKARVSVDSVEQCDEIDQLRQRVKWLEMENAYLKALRDLTVPRES